MLHVLLVLLLAVVGLVNYCELLLILVFRFLVLVGAFSDFGRADTGKPVQN